VKVFEEISFHSRHLDPSIFSRRGAEYGGAEFRKCHFDGCSLSACTKKVGRRVTVRNAVFSDCSIIGCGIGPAIIEDIIIKNLRMHGTSLFIWGAVFRHVELRGTITGAIKASHLFDLFRALEKPHLQEPFDEANTEFYKSVDWALDISKGRFSDLCILNVPSRLIRRDPSTQVVLTREKAASVAWKDLGLKDAVHWRVWSDILLTESKEPDIVIVPPLKRNRGYEEYFHDIGLLREAGILEPD